MILQVYIVLFDDHIQWILYTFLIFVHRINLLFTPYVKMDSYSLVNIVYQKNSFKVKINFMIFYLTDMSFLFCHDAFKFHGKK